MPDFPRAECERLTEMREGRRKHVYVDTLGHPTVGIGFNLDRPDAARLLAFVGADYYAVREGGADLTDDQVDRLFDHTLTCAINLARVACPTFDTLPDPAKLVLVDGAFQLGGAGLAAFKDMLGHIARAEWNDAADALLDSRMAVQTPMRAKSNAAMLRSLDKPVAVTPIDLSATLDMPRPSSRDKEA